MAPPNDSDPALRAKRQLALMALRKLADEHWFTFTRPLQAMDDHAWVGGASARAFARELERCDRELHAQLRKAIALVEAELRRVPLT